MYLHSNIPTNFVMSNSESYGGNESWKTRFEESFSFRIYGGK